MEPELKKQLLDIVEFEATIFAARNGATVHRLGSDPRILVWAQHLCA